MTTLTDRAERALLGALLTEPLLIRQVPMMEPDDFTVSHRDIYRAIVPQDPREFAGWAGGTSPNAAFARAMTAADPLYLQQMQQECPDPSHAAAYAQMVLEAGLRRQLALGAIRLEYEAGNLHHGLRRLESTDPHGLDLGVSRDGPTIAQQALGHLLELALALRAHARAFDPGVGTTEGADPLDAEPEPAALPGSGAVSPAAAAWAITPSTPARALYLQAQREELALGGLIQQCDRSGDIPAWLPAEAFTAGPRKQIYEALVSLHARGEPADELIVDWELAKRRATAIVLRQARPDEPLPLTGYMSRLARSPVDTAAVIDACHALFRERGGTQPAHAQPLPPDATALANGHLPGRPALQPPPPRVADPGPELRM